MVRGQDRRGTERSRRLGMSLLVVQETAKVVVGCDELGIEVDRAPVL